MLTSCCIAVNAFHSDFVATSVATGVPRGSAARITAASIWPSTRKTSRSTLAIWPRRSKPSASKGRCRASIRERFGARLRIGKRREAARSKADAHPCRGALCARSVFNAMSIVRLLDRPLFAASMVQASASLRHVVLTQQVLRPGSIERVRRTQRLRSHRRPFALRARRRRAAAWPRKCAREPEPSRRFRRAALSQRNPTPTRDECERESPRPCPVPLRAEGY